jgi:hypothetical protein
MEKINTLQPQNNEKEVWHRAEPIVTDTAIMIPAQTYYKEGTYPMYVEAVTKECFVKAYKKWILGETEDGTDD